MKAINISENTKKINSLYLGFSVDGNRFSPGQLLKIRWGKSRKEELESCLQKNGWITGMSKLYYALNLEPGDVLNVVHQPPDVIEIVEFPEKAGVEESGIPKVETECVFEQFRLKPIHVEIFNPSSFEHWEPETEPDIYLAFGALQGFTEYKYVCGFNKDVRKRLRYPEDRSLPDAILVSRNSDQYLLAEFKMLSSDFTKNHRKEDVDILIVWLDDEINRDVLPRKVVELKMIAKDYTKTLFE